MLSASVVSPSFLEFETDTDSEGKSKNNHEQPVQQHGTFPQRLTAYSALLPFFRTDKRQEFAD